MSRKTLAEFYSDLCREYSSVKAESWKFFRVDSLGKEHKEDIAISGQNFVTGGHYAFGGNTHGKDFDALCCLSATNPESVIGVSAKYFYEDFAEKVKAAKDSKDEALSVAEQALTFRIVDQITYVAAGEITKDIKRLRKEVEATFEPIIEKAYAAHREACAQKARYLEPLKRGEQAIKNALLAYRQAEERRIAEVRRAQEAAHEQELADFEAHKNEVKQKLYAEGRIEEAIKVSGAFLPNLPPAEIVPKAEGIYKHVTYCAEITDFSALVRAAAECPSLEHFLLPNQKALDGAARESKGKESKIPGVRFIAKESMRVRA